MKEIWLSIQNYDDRKNMVWALSCAGFKVRVKDEQDNSIPTIHTYWVIVEVPENNIKAV